MQEIELAHGAVRINITNHGETIPRLDVKELVDEFKLKFATARFSYRLDAQVAISQVSLPGRPIRLTFVGGVAEFGPINGLVEALLIMPPAMSIDALQGAKQTAILLFSALSLRQSGAFSPENFEELRRRMAERMNEAPEDSDPKEIVDALLREIKGRDRRNPPSSPPPQT